MSERRDAAQVIPMLWRRDARQAIGWLERAFGFEAALIVDDGQGGVIHSELLLGGAKLYVLGPQRSPGGTRA